MAVAAAAGDVARATKLAEAITRLEASAPVIPEMLEGTWIVDEVIQNGVSDPSQPTDKHTVLIFQQGQRFQREIEVETIARSYGTPFVRPVCSLDPVHIVEMTF